MRYHPVRTPQVPEYRLQLQRAGADNAMWTSTKLIIIFWVSLTSYYFVSLPEQKFTQLRTSRSISTMIQAVVSAGGVLQQLVNDQRTTVSTKTGASGGQEPVTNGDIISNHLLMKVLATRMPGVHIISEEKLAPAAPILQSNM